jgi:hypothetical protein
MRKQLAIPPKAVLRIGMYLLMALSFVGCHGLFWHSAHRSSVHRLMSEMGSQSDEDKISWYGQEIERPKVDYIAIAEKTIDEGPGQWSWAKINLIVFSFLAGCVGTFVVWLIFLSFKVYVFPVLPDPKAAPIEVPPRQGPI